MAREDIVFLSTADWDHPFWTNKQHVAVQLAKRGHKVFYIDSVGLRRPTLNKRDVTRILRRIIKAIQPPRKVRENLWVWSPLVLPFHRFFVVRKLNRILFNNWLEFWLRRFKFRKEILWTYSPLTIDLIDIQHYEKIVYHCVDEIKAQPGIPANLLVRCEQELTKRCDVVFVTSPKLLETRKTWNDNIFYFPNVADYQHFSSALDMETPIPEDLLVIPPPRIGFIGALSSYKVDFHLIRFVAERHPEWSIVLIGQIGEGDPWTDPRPLIGLSNIHILGPRPYSQLPCYLKGIDVAILPNVLNEYTEAMFPMKFFEYLAAGKPIVSVNLPALLDFKEVAYLASSPSDFVRGIELALEGSFPPLEARLRVARLYTYETRTEKMMQIVDCLEKKKRR